MGLRGTVQGKLDKFKFNKNKKKVLRFPEKNLWFSVKKSANGSCKTKKKYFLNGSATKRGEGGRRGFAIKLKVVRP